MSSSGRTLAVLALFTLERSELTVEEAANLLGATIRTTYRRIRALSEAGFLTSSGNGKYVLGPACLRLDWLVRNTDPLIRAATPVLENLMQNMPVPAVALICRLYKNDEVMCVLQSSTKQPGFASSYQRGRPLPLFRGAASKAILAFLPKRMVRRLHADHAGDMAGSGLGTTFAQVEQSLAKIRDEGVSIASGELDPGLTGIGAPLTGPDVLPLGSISLVVANPTFTPEVDARIRKLLATSAEQISTALQA